MPTEVVSEAGQHTRSSVSRKSDQGQAHLWRALRWHVEWEVGFLFSVHRRKRAAGKGGPKCANAGCWNPPCAPAKGAFKTEKLAWFHFFKWVGTANAIGWPVSSFFIWVFSFDGVAAESG